ncbi:MAG: DUF2961 domain-containing protein [Bacteroidales bacterium]|nr:DUF2961 domain-containing protein [Candidatus Cacconaster equifaecalis]
MKRFLTIVLLVAVGFSSNAGRRNRLPEYRMADELRQLSRLDLLPSYRSGAVDGVSSYDSTGGNNDGFDGKYSYLRKEEGKLVIADFKGPGVIDRIWTPTATNDTLEFWFDGEKQPRLKICFMDLFRSGKKPFVYPLCGNEVGGYFCYFPFTFKKSCKITFSGEMIQFHQISYRSLEGYDVETFRPELSAEESSLIDEICRKWSNDNPDVTQFLNDGTIPLVKEENFFLEPGGEFTFFESHDAGRILGFEIEGGAVFEGLNKDIILTAQWDDDPVPAINAPVADYFGYAYGKPSMEGLFVGSDHGRHYSFFPAPYDKSARITLKYRERPGIAQAPVQLTTRVHYSNEARNLEKEGKFYACWRREKPQKGKPYKFLSHKGRGHYVGTVLIGQGFDFKSTDFFEGDDSTYVDGASRVHGTGSEDYLNGGWYSELDRWDKATSLPTHGCLEFAHATCRSAGYRFFIGDKQSFNANIWHGIEHGGIGNEAPVDYTSVAFYYADSPSVDGMEPTEELCTVYVPQKYHVEIRNLPITTSYWMRTENHVGSMECWSPGEDLIRVVMDKVPEGRYRIVLSYLKRRNGAEFSLWQRQKMLLGWTSTASDTAIESYEDHPDYFNDANWVDTLDAGIIEITPRNNTITFRMRGEDFSRPFEFGNIILERL